MAESMCLQPAGVVESTQVKASKLFLPSQAFTGKSIMPTLYIKSAHIELEGTYL